MPRIADFALVDRAEQPSSAVKGRMSTAQPPTSQPGFHAVGDGWTKTRVFFIFCWE